MKVGIILFTTLAIFGSAYSQSVDWKKIAIPEKLGSIYSFVDFSDSLHGLLCSADGYMTLTSDGGRSWTPVQRAVSSGAIFKAKMADSGTALVAVNPEQGNTKIYKITRGGMTKDTLTLPLRVVQTLLKEGSVTILNPHIIGCVTADTSQYFISTKNFGTSWDTLLIDRAYRRGKILAIEALDSVHFIVGTSSAVIGLGGGGRLHRSDDGGKTLQVIESSGGETVGMKIFTKMYACFGITQSFDMTPTTGTILLYNIAMGKGTAFNGGSRAQFSGMGTLFFDGSHFSISTDSYLKLMGNAIYQLIESSTADSLKFSALAIGGQRSYWYLTQEGRLFTNADNPTIASGYFPLQIGNIWQYYSDDPFDSEKRTSKIVGDTLMPNSKHYAVMSGSNLGTPILRQEGSRVYGYDKVDSAEYVLLDYAANANDTLSSHSKGKWTNIAGGKLTYPGTNSSYWRFYQRMNTGLSGYIFLDWIIKDSLGVTSWTEEPGARYSFSGAIVDGRTIGTITGIRDDANKIPTVFSLSQNFPNPFNPSTTISFSLPSRSFVSLKIFDVMGRDVATIVSEHLPVGSYQRVWSASGISSGIYIYRLQAGAWTETKRMLLIR